MIPENYRYGGGASEMLLHPGVAVALVLALVCLLLLPRKYALLPLLWMALLVPAAQQIYIGGMHFFALRIAIMVGLIRVVASPKESNGKFAGGLNGVDRAFLIYVLAQAVCIVLLFREVGAFINQVGFLIDWVGGYVLARWMIQDEEDVYRSLKYLAVLMIPVAIGMVIEQFKAFNIFSVLGGLPVAPEMREGRVRSQGIFSHSLMAGCFAAVSLPLFVMLWKEGKAKLFGWLGALAASVMMVTTFSSTPLLAYAAGIGAIFAWPLRKSMRKVRWGMALALIALNFVMKAPVWFLIAHIDLTAGSSSYHRAVLVDQFVQHFRDWWLVGTNANADWGYSLWDIQNQYVNVGQTGGLLTLIFFILVISRSFGRIGQARELIEGERHQEWVLWLLGCSLFADTVAYFGVNYFDQSRVGWFLLLAMISAVTSPILANKPAEAPEPQKGWEIWRLWRTGNPVHNGAASNPKEPVRRLQPWLRRP